MTIKQYRNDLLKVPLSLLLLLFFAVVVSFHFLIFKQEGRLLGRWDMREIYRQVTLFWCQLI